MKTKRILVIVCCIVVALLVAGWWLMKPRNGEPMVVSGHLERFKDFQSKYVEPKGWDDAHFQSLVFEGHSHKETDWAKRLDKPLYFLLH